uniref:Uncharacterized protein n=1 Tax=uncultured marine virus TaxID=186617 RepID=A0A0F7L4T6_9VIRU|nr:hypothetical protein [uncultured marine virus]
MPALCPMSHQQLVTSAEQRMGTHGSRFSQRSLCSGDRCGRRRISSRQGR